MVLQPTDLCNIYQTSIYSVKACIITDVLVNNQVEDSTTFHLAEKISDFLECPSVVE